MTRQRSLLIAQLIFLAQSMLDLGITRNAASNCTPKKWDDEIRHDKCKNNIDNAVEDILLTCMKIMKSANFDLWI